MLNIENVCSFGPKGNKNRSCDNCHGQEHDTEQPGNEPNLPREASKRPKNARKLVAFFAGFVFTAQMVGASASYGEEDSGFIYALPDAITDNLFIGMKENVYPSVFSRGYTNQHEVQREGWHPNDPLQDLKTLGITHIATCCYFGGSEEPPELVRRVKDLNMKISICKMEDRPRAGRTDLKEALEKQANFMREGTSGNNKLLIHCKAGQNRSVSLAMAFIMTNMRPSYENPNPGCCGSSTLQGDRTLKEAWNMVFPARQMARVHPAYEKQLEQLELETYNKISKHNMRTTEDLGDIARKILNVDVLTDSALFGRNKSLSSTKTGRSETSFGTFNWN